MADSVLAQELDAETVAALEEVGEGTTAARSGEHAREIEDDEVVERAESGGVAGFHVTIMADGAGLCAGGDI